MVSHDEQRRVLKGWHSEPTSGHFGVTKTYKRIAERFYWKSMITDVRQLVSQPLFLLFDLRHTRPSLAVSYIVFNRYNHLSCVPEDEQQEGWNRTTWAPPHSYKKSVVLTLLAQYPLHHWLATATFSDYFTRFGWAKALATKEAEGIYSFRTEGGM